MPRRWAAIALRGTRHGLVAISLALAAGGAVAKPATAQLAQPAQPATVKAATAKANPTQRAAAAKRQARADDALPAAVAEALRQAQVPAEALAAVVLPVGHIGPELAAGKATRKATRNATRNAPSAGRQPAPAWATQADLPMPPSSTLKLVTSIVALDRLGPNHRGFTELLTLAPIENDVLAGDLIVRGGADPELGLPQLWALLGELRWQHGIREIAGDIVLDRRLFRGPREVASQPPFDERPEFAYNAIPDALQLNNNLLGLELSSEGAGGAQGPVSAGTSLGARAFTGGPISARLMPPLEGLEIDTSALRLSSRACRDWGEDWISPPRVAAEPESGRLRVTLQGGFPRGCTQRTALALIPRNALAERHLRWAWEGQGGVWRGRLRELGELGDRRSLSDDQPLLVAPVSLAAQKAALSARSAGAPPPSWLAPGVAWAGTSTATAPGVRLLARRLARPWGELLRAMNKQSDNPSARLLYLSLGLGAMADSPQASTQELAHQAVRGWLAQHRIDATGLVLDNGSGLSRSERLTPRQLALMLVAAQAGRWGPELMMSLPVAGVDGTLRNRFKDSPATGRARLKTGSLKNAIALAGYVPDPQGRWWALSAMISHDQAGAARPALDALVDWVAGGGLAGGLAIEGRQRNAAASHD